jgi:hypothetical protein
MLRLRASHARALRRTLRSTFRESDTSMHSRSIAPVLILALLAVPAFGHGYAGERFFPPTITTDDPFAADELAFPTITAIKNSDDVREVDIGFELDKLIIPNLSFGVSETHVLLYPHGEKRSNGWENVELNVKYNAYVNEPHEFIASFGLGAEIGGTGSRAIGRDAQTTFEPLFFFGKGFGDLPDSLAMLKPIAVTGVIGQTFPMGGDEPNVLEWGFSVQYQLPYLQSKVKDVGLPRPLRDMIPLVEFPFETGENRGEKGITTGSINPGILWEIKWAQIGAEAIIPVNKASGSHVGFVFQVWIFLDDLDSKHFGHPIFGGGR